MKKSMIAGLVGAATIGLFAATALAEDGTQGSLTGELVDTSCYFKANAHGAGHQACAAKCAKSGIPVGVLDEKSGKVYVITVPSSALAKVMAKTARVTGEIFEGSHVIMPTEIQVEGEEGTWTDVKLPAMK